MLPEGGYHVFEVTSNEESLRLAEQESSALILLNADSDDRYRLLADNAPALMCMNGPEGCEFVNREYLQLLDVDEVDGRVYDWAQFASQTDGTFIGSVGSTLEMTGIHAATEGEER